MAELARKPRGAPPRKKELQGNSKSFNETTSTRQKRERELLEGGAEQRYYHSDTFLNSDSSILHSPLHSTAPHGAHLAFLSEFERSSRSLLRSPEVTAINGHSSHFSCPIPNGGYFYSSSSEPQRQKKPEVEEEDEEERDGVSDYVIHVKNIEGGEKAAPQKLFLEFSGLTYTVCRKQSRFQRLIGALLPSLKRPPPKLLRVLDGISGEARDGEILAIMGPSGSGKSTLIDALAQRIDAVKGSMTLNGNHFGERLLRNISAYVMQV